MWNLALRRTKATVAGSENSRKDIVAKKIVFGTSKRIPRWQRNSIDVYFITVIFEFQQVGINPQFVENKYSICLLTN